jgi:hypothetical protein
MRYVISVSHMSGRIRNGMFDSERIESAKAMHVFENLLWHRLTWFFWNIRLCFRPKCGSVLGYRLLRGFSFSGFDDVLEGKCETAVVTQLIVSGCVHLVAFNTLRVRVWFLFSQKILHHGVLQKKQFSLLKQLWFMNPKYRYRINLCRKPSSIIKI